MHQLRMFLKFILNGNLCKSKLLRVLILYTELAGYVIGNINLFLKNNDILITNINQNEVEQPILSELKLKSLSEQRRNFALGAQSIINLPNNNFE